jgi:imidazolonepropionase-like amidohydrolase/Tol biopolymer transport system component
MKYGVAAAVIAVFGLAQAQAQTAPPAAAPVAKTQGPEDKARRAETPPAAPAAAQSAPAKPAKWDVNAPPGAIVRQVPINVDEGTWMNVDVSPDGRTIAFDLLGDIYTLPIGGGAPTRIAEGLAYEVQPRFSPDGKRIAFTSDRGGGDNIWVMNRDGSDKRQVTKEDFRLLNQPTWSADGRFIAAKKHFTTGRSLGTGEVWLYHVSGGSGVALVKRANEAQQKELGEPTFAPDGKSFFYTRNVTPGLVFEYAQDSNTDLFNIERYDLTTGEVTTVASGPGGSVRPTPSPDGKKIAFVRRERTRSKLYVKDLASGVERKIYDALDQDVQETWAITGLYPNMSWTPDGKSVVFWAGGKIRRVDADGANSAVIPFRVNDTRGVAEASHPKVAVSPDRFTTRMVRFAAVSPDGRQVVFESLGKLFVKSMGAGTPRRLTKGDEGFELFPAWSRDGRTIAFVAWTDAGLGRIRVAPASGGASREVVKESGHYGRLAFSPDGRTLAFERRAGGGLTSTSGAENPGVYRVALAGGAPVRVLKDAEAPQFGAASDRLFMVANEKGKLTLISTTLDGDRRRTHATGELASDYIVSPDEQFFAFRQNAEVSVMPLMPGPQDVPVDLKGGPFPVTRASAGGADYINWSQGGAQLHWSQGPTVFTAPVAALFANAPAEENAPKFTPPTTGVSMAREVVADRPSGAVALTGARIVTMAATDGGIIEDGVIVVQGDRIAAVGRRGAVTIPAGARTVDVGGKTIIPGLVDAHAHGPEGDDEVVPQQNWAMIANLALGTTTVHNPSSRASEIFAAAEMQRAGVIIGPRTFSTGEPIYGAKSRGYAQIDSLDDALAQVRRLKAQGGGSIKNYNQPRREERQQVMEASRREGMQVVAEGGSLFGFDMTLIADGVATLEHNIPLSTFYEDVLSYFSQSKTNYTPTLVVTFGGPAGDPYWRSHTDVFEQPILKRHIPPAELAASSARRVIAPEGDYVDDDSAREAHKLAQRGVLVSIGAHGQQDGIGSHWELWSFVRGGMSPIEALRAGTIVPARSLGMDADIGSLEAGKLADLVVLDADPTVDIRNSEKVNRVMLGGRLYDPLTMNEVITGTRVRAPYWWEQSAR